MIFDNINVQKSCNQNKPFYVITEETEEFLDFSPEQNEAYQ